MKKFIFALIAMVMMTVSATAMSYEQARQQALFLTDKMAYELNLTDEQYEAAYEINLDYLMGVRTVDDLYGTYWERRNLDLSYILLSWQYRAFCDAAYFYRPLYWNAGYWHFGVYARYPYRDYFFFGRPTVYIEYRGGHSWHMNGGRSWYRDRRICPPHHNNYFGMRDGFRRGDFGNGYSGNPSSRTQFGTAQRPPMMNNGTIRSAMATLTVTTLSLVQVAAPQLLLVATALLAAMVARAAPAAPSATRRAPLAADAQAQRRACPATRSHPVVTRVAHRHQAQASA